MKSFLPLFFAITSLLCQSTYASPTTATPQDSINAKVTSIDAFVTKYRKIIKYLPKVTAYTRIGYLTDNETSNFSINNVYFGLSGDFASKFEYKLLFDFANPRILDASFTYKPADCFNITVGQFKLPFTIGNSYSPLGEECIDFPLAIQRLVGYNDVCGIASGAGRDVGVNLSGALFKQATGYSRLEYNLAVVNGNGATLKDNNKSKDVMGRLSFYPLKKLIISASYMYGEYGPDYAKKNRISGGLSFKDKYLVVRTEYLCDVAREVNSYGGYALIMGNVTDKISVLTRFDFFSESNSNYTPMEINYTIGANYMPFKFLRLQANYVRRTYSETKVHTSPNQLQAMVTGIF